MAKKHSSKKGIIPLEVVQQKIFVVRGRRVMLDRDLAELFGVETRVLNQAVKRNSDRFPEDFMFRLTMEEARAADRSRSQSVTLKRGRNTKYRPHVFSEHGAVMLANVLQSTVAVRASIQVVRAFVNLRQILATHQDLARKMEALERKIGKHDADLDAILEVMQDLLEPPPSSATKRPIGFVAPAKKS